MDVKYLIPYWKLNSELENITYTKLVSQYVIIQHIFGFVNQKRLMDI